MNQRLLRRAEQLTEFRGKRPACTTCHARKVKCSGNRPCEACIQSSSEAGCIYPKRDRQLRVSQSYLEELLAENKRLREQELEGSRRDSDVGRNPTSPVVTRNEGQHSEPKRNPLFEDRPWFLPMATLSAPVLIGEAADAAFATRLRQSLSKDVIRHIPRLHYPDDNTILSLGRTPCELPHSAKARLLINMALRVISEDYHIVLKSVVLADFAKFMQASMDSNILLASKMWALLAIGELYSTRSVLAAPEYPGLAYFAQASRALQVLEERPSLDSIELLLLLSFYSSACNRSHSAYLLAGSAVRLGVIMGLHVNVPEVQLSDRVTREHRNRVWWTAYEFDRWHASKLSQPVAIQDEDIQVDLPSNAGLPPLAKDDFEEVDHNVARIKLAGLSGQITKVLYARKPEQEPFLQRVQQVLKNLQDWIKSLPAHLHADDAQRPQSVSSRTRSLMLTFNQCMMVTTRPVLLLALLSHSSSQPGSSSSPNVPENLRALMDVCIKCARHSYSMLMESWMDGSFPTRDNSKTRCLFSAALVLAIARILSVPGSSRDGENFEQVVHILTELRQGGNCAAEGFLLHLYAIRTYSNSLGTDSREVVSEAAHNSANQEGIGGELQGNTDSPVCYEPFVTAGMALSDPSIQAFLSQADISFQSMETGLGSADLDSFFWSDI